MDSAESGNPYSHLVASIKENEMLSVITALGKGVDVNVHIGNVGSLHMASVMSDPSLLSILLFYGAEVNSRDGCGRSALHYAAENSRLCVAELLRHKADPNITDSNGATPLHWAAYKGNADCVEVLLSHGADVNAANFDGETALFWAVKKSRLKVVQILLDFNANPCIENLKQEQPLSKSLLLFYLGFQCEDDYTILNLLCESMGQTRYKILQQSPDIMDQVQGVTRKHAGVLRLQHICRYVIRQACGRSYLPKSIQQLPVSRSLKLYLLMASG